MTLQEKILQSCQDKNLSLLASRMGYSNQFKGAKRIHRVIHDEFLGLREGGWDGIYGSSEFIRKLCQAISVDADGLNIDGEIKNLESTVHQQLFGYIPWIFVETNFKRVSQPIHALAASESLRRIKVDQSISALADDCAIEELKQIITHHYQEISSDSSGNKVLGIWGAVAYYDCHLREDETIRVSPQGVLIDVLKEEVQHDFSRCIV